MTPDRQDELASEYTAGRARLTNIAYAVLGSYTEAEDVVSDCWMRLAVADSQERIRDVEAWATVAVARASLDVLRSARRRRELYVGPWLPEPLVEGAVGSAPDDPADQVTLDDTVRYALLVVLENLSPAERTSWVLHDLFGIPFAEIAEAVGRTPAAVRQLASRARSHVSANAPRVEVSVGEHDAAVRAFLGASAGGSLSDLLAALDAEVVLTSDGGGLVTAARQPIVGAEKVARMLQGLFAKMGAEERLEPIKVNGELGVGVFDGSRLTTAIILTLDGDKIVRLDLVRSPEKLPSWVSIGKDRRP